MDGGAGCTRDEACVAARGKPPGRGKGGSRRGDGSAVPRRRYKGRPPGGTFTVLTTGPAIIVEERADATNTLDIMTALGAGAREACSSRAG